MSVEIKVTNGFKKQAKKLLKKYKSLSSDLSNLNEELMENPEVGVHLGRGLFKIRLRTKSKGKGKSGGGRVISFVETELIGLVEKENKTVNLIAIYDKSEVETISDQELQNLLSDL